MKRVFLLSLGLLLGVGAFAQRQVIKDDSRSTVVDSKKAIVGTEVVTSASDFTPQAAKSVVVNRFDDLEYAATMWTHYDLQSNGYLSNRMVQFDNGTVAVTATMSHENNQTASDRGTGYNFFNGSEWGDQPETRVESMRTGWPSIAQWGATGEILVSHAPMRCWIREVAGEGEWQFKGELPLTPANYPYAGSGDDASWPRIATSGDNHNIAHIVGCIQHAAGDNYLVYLRSEDAENWTISSSPMEDHGDDRMNVADGYAIAANGHTVAMIFSGDLQAHIVMYKSEDDGLTWDRVIVWENPYAGCDWETDSCSIYTDTLFGPQNASLVIDNNGVAHVALNVYEYGHFELGTTYTVFHGRAVDGIYYWNDTRTAPIQSQDGNPHHALRLWWPAGDGYVHMDADSTKWIGFIPTYEGFEWDNDMFYNEHDYFYAFYGASALPALSCDPAGNLACAFSTPYAARNNGSYYYRNVFVSYYSAADGYWRQDEVNLMDDFEYSYSEGTGVNAANNTVNYGEFWFSYQIDPIIGFYWGSNATQTEGSQNDITVAKIFCDIDGIAETEAKDVVYNIYPNPATDYVVVKSAMSANAVITFTNLAGQTVKSINKSLVLGENTINIDLESGVYFCTVTANGFSKTTKVVVK